MAEDLPDFLKNAEAPPPEESSLSDILERASRMHTLATEIERLESELIEKKAELNEISNRELPRMMIDAGIDNIGIPGVDADIVVSPYYHANIRSDWPEEKQEAAFRNLDEAGYGTIIRARVQIEFDKTEYEEAKELAEFIRREWRGANAHPPVIGMTVPWNTLTAAVRRDHARSVETNKPMAIDVEKVGATIGRVAKLKKRTDK